MLTVNQSATVADILPAAVAKLCALDKDMVSDGSYVQTARESSMYQAVMMTSHKAFTGCQYQKLVLFQCNKDDYEAS